MCNVAGWVISIAMMEIDRCVCELGRAASLVQSVLDSVPLWRDAAVIDAV